MLVGYARTSTVEQTAGLEAQLRDLKAAGCARVFSEQISSVDVTGREEFATAMDFVREGDTLVVTKLDRLARSVAHCLAIVATLEQKTVGLKVLNLGIDTATPTGLLLLQMLAAVGEFERGIMLERQREGIAKAKAAGKYRGRKPTDPTIVAEARRLDGEGVARAEIARSLGIARSTVYLVLNEAA